MISVIVDLILEYAQPNYRHRVVSRRFCDWFDTFISEKGLYTIIDRINWYKHKHVLDESIYYADYLNLDLIMKFHDLSTILKVTDGCQIRCIDVTPHHLHQNIRMRIRWLREDYADCMHLLRSFFLVLKKAEFKCSEFRATNNAKNCCILLIQWPVCDNFGPVWNLSG